ncbi:MAG: hypothetical protein RLY93_19475 [Sumerlaeia bacterium]
MLEANTRVLLDRSVLRVDGHPFFTLAARLYLTPLDAIASAVADLAQAGFTAVMSPPASPGNLPVLETLFDEAESRGLMVILAGEARLPDAGHFLAENFRHRPGLHSYCLPVTEMPPAGSADEAFARFQHERDRIRRLDLHHPVWTPFRTDMAAERWMGTNDFLSIPHPVGGPILPELKPLELLARLRETAASSHAPRPLFCHALECGASNAARLAGIFNDDMGVSLAPARAESWFPYMARLGSMARRDFFLPDPDLLLLKATDLLGAGARGIVLHFYEYLLGQPPITGRDRFCAMAVLAQKIAALDRFFSEGRPPAPELQFAVDPGHPRVTAQALQHGQDILIILRRTGPGEDYWIDSSPLPPLHLRVEIALPHEDLRAWRADFPSGRELQVSKALRGAIEILLPEFPLTAMVLLSSSRERPRETIRALGERLPAAARYAVEGSRVRLEKAQVIERELEEYLGMLNTPSGLLEQAWQAQRQAESALEADRPAVAFACAEEAATALRRLIDAQMTTALGVSGSWGDTLLDLLKRSYCTLPRFYRELRKGAMEASEEYT